jgi:WD40 repeat protein
MKIVCALLLFAVGIPEIGTAGVSESALTVLRDNCLRCHGEDKRKGGLALHTREAMLLGGDSGPALEGTDSAQSLLIRVLSAGADPHMPPKKQLGDDEIEILAAWVRAGTPWNDETLRSLPARAVGQWKSVPTRFHPVGALAISPDAKRLAVARGPRVELFDLSEKEVKAGVMLSGHRDSVRALAWSPDGAYLASAGYGLIRVWRGTDGAEVKQIRDGIAGRVTKLVFTRDGKNLVAADSVASVGSQLHVIASGDWSVIQRIPAHKDAVYDLTLSADGKLLASASADRLVKLWSTADWSARGVLEGHTDYVMSAAFDPAGERIATGGADASIKVWNVATRKQVCTFSDRKSELAVVGLHWRRDPGAKNESGDDWIISAGEDGTPRLFTDLVAHEGGERSNGAKMKAWPKAEAGLAVMDWSEAADRLIGGDVSGGVTIWDGRGKVVNRIGAP